MNSSCSSLAQSLGIPDRLWFLEIVIGILILVGINFLFKRILKQIRTRSLSGRSRWKEKIDYILYLPFQVLMWVLGISLVIEILGHRFDFSFFGAYIDAFRSTGFVLCVGWVLLRWKRIVQKQLLSQEAYVQKENRGLAYIIGKIISVIITVLALMVILQVWGLDVGPLIAFGGIGAASIGFAAKDVLANLFGGIMLHVNRPFMIGDFINLPSQSVEGNVEEIGWNLTTVRDKDKRPVYLPNSTFSSTLVINGARMSHRRILEKIGIRYEDFEKIPALVSNLQQAITRHPDIDSYLPVLVVFNGFGSSTLDLLIDVYTLKTRYDEFLLSKHHILLLIYQEIMNIGAEIAYPVISINPNPQK